MNDSTGLPQPEPTGVSISEQQAADTAASQPSGTLPTLDPTHDDIVNKAFDATPTDDPNTQDVEGDQEEPQLFDLREASVYKGKDKRMGIRLGNKNCRDCSLLFPQLGDAPILVKGEEIAPQDMPCSPYAGNADCPSASFELQWPAMSTQNAKRMIIAMDQAATMDKMNAILVSFKKLSKKWPETLRDQTNTELLRLFGEKLIALSNKA